MGLTFFSLPVSEERLTELFNIFGPITEIDLARNGRFALITFENPTAAQAALAMNGQEVDGKSPDLLFFLSKRFLSLCLSFPSSPPLLPR